MLNSKHINKIIAIIMCFAILASALIVYGANNFESSYVPEYQKRLFGSDIITINILADETEWMEMLANASTKEYIEADVIVNGVRFEGVGIRTKGNASLSQVSQSGSPERYSLHINFGKYIKGQTCFGLDTLILNNMVSDTTYMKEYMSQDIMRYIGVNAPLTNYASISVNGEGFGFYAAIEYYGNSYLDRVYGSSTGNLYNVKTMAMGGNAGNFGVRNRENQNNEADAPAANDWNDRANFVDQGGGSSGGTLQYTDDNISSYSAIFNNSHGTVSESDQQSVVEALKNLSDGTELEKYFNVDEILRYFAAHTVVVNLDSYYSNMAQNYFILERNGQVSILPWDYHLSYGGFQSGNASDVVNFAIDTPVSGVNMEDRPLLNKLLEVEEYKEKYHEYLNQIVEGYFNSGLFEETVRTLQEKISGYVKNDPSAYYTYDQFEAGVDMLIQLNLLRSESIAGQLDGTIPSTTSGQNADSSSLTDASAINLSTLGSMGGGGGMGGGNFGGNRPDGNQGGFDRQRPDNMPNDNQGGFNGQPPDMSQMQSAMEILRSSENGDLSEEQTQQLHDLGLSDDEITQFQQMFQNGFQQGGNPQDQNAVPDNGAQDFSDGQNINPNTPASEPVNQVNWVVYGILLFMLSGSILFMMFYKRRRMLAC